MNYYGFNFQWMFSWKPDQQTAQFESIGGYEVDRNLLDFMLENRNPQ